MLRVGFKDFLCGIQLIELDLVIKGGGILGLEGLDHGAVAAPVVRQRDGGELAFGLGGFVKRGKVGLRRGRLLSTSPSPRAS